MSQGSTAPLPQLFSIRRDPRSIVYVKHLATLVSFAAVCNMTPETVDVQPNGGYRLRMECAFAKPALMIARQAVS